MFKIEKDVYIKWEWFKDLGWERILHIPTKKKFIVDPMELPLDDVSNEMMKFPLDPQYI